LVDTENVINTYDVDVRTINDHIQKIYADAELIEESTIRNYQIVQTKGTRQVNCSVKHVSPYLDIAELQAMRHIPMTMGDWEKQLNGFLTLMDRDVLRDSGKISA